MDKDRHGTRGGVHSVFYELVAARPAPAADGNSGAVHRNDNGGVRLPADGRAMGEPPAEDKPHGRCVQQRERILHAGDAAPDQ